MLIDKGSLKIQSSGRKEDVRFPLSSLSCTLKYSCIFATTFLLYLETTFFDNVLCYNILVFLRQHFCILQGKGECFGYSPLEAA